MVGVGVTVDVSEGIGALEVDAGDGVGAGPASIQCKYDIDIYYCLHEGFCLLRQL